MPIAGVTVGPVAPEPASRVPSPQLGLSKAPGANAHGHRARKLIAQSSRRALVECRDLVESRLGTARTVGDVWRINTQLARLDARLDAS